MAFLLVSIIIALFQCLVVVRLESYGTLSHLIMERKTSLVSTLTKFWALNYGIVLLYLVWLYPSFFSPLRDFPRPKWFLARLILSRFVLQEAQGEFIREIVDETHNDGIINFRELFTQRLLLTKTDLIAEILVQHPYDFVKPQNVRNFMRHFLGDGLIITEGEKHKLLRRNTDQAFGFRQIRDLYPTMWTKASDLVNEIDNLVSKQKDKGQIIEVMEWASKVTMDVIGIAGLGHDFNTLATPDDPLVKSYEAATGDHMLLYFVMSMWFSFEFVQKLPWNKNVMFKESTSQMKNICHRLIRQKKRALRQNPDLQVDILSHLIRTEKFTDDELADQLLTFLVAGHDTTSASLTWTCYLLARNPEWKESLQNEVRSILPKFTDGSNCDGGDDIARLLESLPILNGVLNEALRLFPTVPLTTRVAVRDTSLGGRLIPKDTEVLISPWLVNRSPGLWGGEDCVGQNFAKAELRCLIAAMASRFDWKLAMDNKDVIPAGAITIRPKNGLYLRVSRISAQ
ncbi:cytochrome P450 [Nemania sp. FL0031]|nr:cytochrome P450 [Nemania sp. FL0031]